METEIEQEGTENTWRTADLRIRKTQVDKMKEEKIQFDVVRFGVLSLNFDFRTEKR